jgi:hypothetical protein
MRQQHNPLLQRTRAQLAALVFVMHSSQKPVKAIITIVSLLITFGAEGKALALSIPASYVQALQATDAFLWAWVNHDADAGRRLISRGLIKASFLSHHKPFFYG